MNVAFVALEAYPLFHPSPAEGVDPGLHSGFGGTETRAVLMARALAERPGRNVSFLVRDWGQDHVARCGAITLITYPQSWLSRTATRRLRSAARSVSRCERFPWIRVSQLRPSLLWDLPVGLACRCLSRGFSARSRAILPPWAFQDIQADAFLCFGVNAVSAEVIASCRAYGKQSVLLLVSDANLLELYTQNSSERDAEGHAAGPCYFALTHADVIVAQTEHQQRLLRERFGRDSIVIRNPIDLADEPPATPPAREYVLWIGRADRHSKRPLVCLELARRCLEIPWVMILNPRSPDVEAEVFANLPPNVRVIERVEPERMPKCYRGAKALVNTSPGDGEGFPNTFLQAGKFGTPVFSLEVDPDGIFQRLGCGFAAGGSLDALADRLRAVYSNQAEAQAMASRMAAYLREFHELQGRIDQLESLLGALTAPAPKNAIHG